MSDDQFNSPENPFSKPVDHAESVGDTSTSQGEPGAGYVKQVKVLAILTMVQGGLLLMMGVFVGLYAGFFGNMDKFMPPEELAQMRANGQELPFEVIFWVGLGLAVLVVLLGLMHLFAGFRNLSYSGYGLTITTWIAGLLSCMTCYCIPTSVGLLIYGLVVFLNPAVKQAFAMKRQGVPPGDIGRKFY